jgi:hypothetical protein
MGRVRTQEGNSSLKVKTLFEGSLVYFIFLSFEGGDKSTCSFRKGRDEDEDEMR